MLDVFEIDTGRYPTSDEGLNALLSQPAGVREWHGPYIERGMPKDPWGNPYVYRSPGQHNTASYDLYSFGPDGAEGGGDDIDNWSER
jgi:general secretion pathway protein G